MNDFSLGSGIAIAGVAIAGVIALGIALHGTQPNQRPDILLAAASLVAEIHGT